MSAQNQNPNNHVNLFVDKLCSVFIKEVFDESIPNPIPCTVTDVTASGISVRHGDSGEFADFIPWVNILSIRHTAPLLSDERAPTLSAEAVIEPAKTKNTRRRRRNNK